MLESHVDVPTLTGVQEGEPVDALRENNLGPNFSIDSDSVPEKYWKPILKL